MKGTHGTPGCFKRVVPLVTPVFSTRSSPCCWRHSLPPFLIACGRPNTERSPLPALTVFLLLTGEHQEEGEWVEKTRVQTSGSGRPPEVFFCPAVWGADADVAVLSTKVAGPFLYGVSCEICTHFTVGQRDRCKPTGTTDLHMSYTQKLLQKAVQIWGVSVTDMCLQTPHTVFSCSAV